MKTHPLLIGAINAFFPGLGYLFVRERRVFGALLFTAIAMSFAVTLFDPSPAFDEFLSAVTPLGMFGESFSYLIIMVAFGFDAYCAAKRATPTTVPTVIQPPSVTTQ